MSGRNLFAVVSRPDIRPESRHSSGFPESLSGVPTEAFGWPRVVIIEHRPDGIFLLRYTEDGSFAGDTWHQAIEDAEAQAFDEYGSSVGEWVELPPEAEDRAGFALQYASRTIRDDA